MTQARLGDHLKISRRLYYHHGVYVGDNQVIHYAPPAGMGVGDGIGWRQVLGADSEVNTIHLATLEQFRDNSPNKIEIVSYDHRKVYPPLKVITRAYARIGENGYNLWGNNCGDFVQWCKLVGGRKTSDELWKAAWEGALTGLTGKVYGSRLAALTTGAAIGALTKAAKIWFNKKTVSTGYNEFAAHISAIYFQIATDGEPYPFGQSFYHASQETGQLPPLPHEYRDQVVLFCYRGSMGNRNPDKDWYVTERAILYPAGDMHLHFHHIAAIEHLGSQLLVRDLNGQLFTLPCTYAHAPSVAAFLHAAVCGLTVAPESLRQSMPGRLKTLLHRWMS